jgi:hypothetical protein
LILNPLISRVGNAAHQLVWRGVVVRHLISEVRMVETGLVELMVERRWDERIQVLVNGGRALLDEVGFSANRAGRNFGI